MLLASDYQAVRLAARPFSTCQQKKKKMKNKVAVNVARMLKEKLP